MSDPVHIDGRTVVILRQTPRGFSVVESGVLSFDGETLWIGAGRTRRAFRETEQESLMQVIDKSRIAECRGFDFFVIEEDEEL